MEENTGKQKAKKKKHRRVSAWKIILKSVLLAAVAGLILFATMSLVFVMKVSLSMIEQLDILEDALESTTESETTAMNSLEKKYIGIMNFLKHYQESTGCTDEEMLEFGQSHYSNLTFYILTPDETEKPGAEFYRKYGVDWEWVNKALLGTDISNYSLKLLGEEYAVTVTLSDEKVLCVAIPEESETLFGEVVTTQEAFGTVSQNSQSREGDVSLGFIQIAKSGDIITESDYYRKSEGETDRFTNLTNSLAFSLNRNGTDYRVSTGEVKGEYFIGVSKYNEKLGGDIYYCLRPLVELDTDITMTFFVQMVFFLLLILTGLFVYYLRQYAVLYPDNSSYSPESINNRILVTLLITVIAIGGISYFAQTLFSLSINVLDDADTMEEIAKTYTQSQKKTESMNGSFRDQYNAVLGSLTDYIGQKPEVLSDDELKTLSEIFGLQYVMTYDLDGHETHSSNDIRNYSFPEKGDDPAYILNTLKLGEKSVYIPPEKTVLAGGEGSARFAGNVYSSEHEPLGYLEIGVYPDILYVVSERGTISSVLRNAMLKEGFQYVGADRETHKVVASSEEIYLGKTLSDIGFTDESMEKGFFGLQTIGSELCYASNGIVENYIIFILHPESQVYYSRMPYTIVVIVLFILSILILLHGLRPGRKGSREVLFYSKAEEKKIKERIEGELSGAVSSEEAPQSGKGWRKKLDQFAETWIYMTPESKMSRTFTFLIEAAAVVLLIIFASRELSHRENSLLLRIVAGKWVKGLNVFSLTANVMVVLITIVAAAFCKWILRMIGQISDARGETVTRLLRSALSYVAIFSCFYICLVNFGFNPTSLAASAGFIGIGIGIGARDLITDIVAGLFIMFEGSYQVGDIVEVAGYQGIVHEIGIRTTIVRGWDFNQKIINNRNMSNVLNMSAKHRYSVYGFSIPKSAAVEQLAAAFEEKFKDYCEIYPEVVSVPHFHYVPQKVSGLTECHVIAEITDLSRSVIENTLIKDIQDVLAEQGIRPVWKIVPAGVR